jgi:hypothetical protein
MNNLGVELRGIKIQKATNLPAGQADLCQQKKVNKAEAKLRGTNPKRLDQEFFYFDAIFFFAKKFHLYINEVKVFNR